MALQGIDWCWQGKKEYDKRQTIKERDQKRDIRRKYGV